MGLDFEALLILAVLAFILFGPEKLPQFAAKAGYYLAKLREATTELSQQAQVSFPNLTQPAPPPVQPAAAEPAPPAAQAAQAGINERNCPICAHLVGDDFLFCPNCGHPLKNEASPVPPQSLAS